MTKSQFMKAVKNNGWHFGCRGYVSVGATSIGAHYRIGTRNRLIRDYASQIKRCWEIADAEERKTNGR